MFKVLILISLTFSIHILLNQTAIAFQEEPMQVKEALEVVGLPSGFLDNLDEGTLKKSSYKSANGHNMVTLEVETGLGVMLSASQSREGREIRVALTRPTPDRGLFEAQSFTQKINDGESRVFRVFTEGQIFAQGEMELRYLSKMKRKLTRIDSKGGRSFVNPEKLAKKKRYNLSRLIRYSLDVDSPNSGPQLFLFCQENSYMFDLDVGSAPIALAGTGIVKRTSENGVSKEVPFLGIEKYITDSNLLSCDVAESYQKLFSSGDDTREMAEREFEEVIQRGRQEVATSMYEVQAWKVILNEILDRVSITIGSI